MFINSAIEIKNEILKSIKRFPISIIASILFCIISIGLNNDYFEVNYKYYRYIFYACFWFISIQIYAENYGNKYKLCYSLGTLLFIILYLLDSTDFSYNFLPVAIIFSIFVAPFLNYSNNSEQLWIFNYRMWLRIGFSFLLSAISFIMISGIIYISEYLFGLKIENIYSNCFIVISTLFAPILAMSGIPRTYDEHSIKYPESIKKLSSYVIIPLLFIYAVIIYIYILKIIIAWEMPKGIVIYLVSSFGCSGFIAYLLAYPIRTNKGIIKNFNDYFFKILLAPLVLFALAIYIRINEYGVTESRYAVVLCILWIFISSVFSLTKYKKETPKFMFITFTTLLFLSSFGPWSVTSISAKSQVSRLQKILEKNDILVNEKINFTKKKLSTQDLELISSIVKYLTTTNKYINIKPWFDEIKEASIHKEKKVTLARDIVEEMGIEYIGYVPYSKDNAFHFNSRPKDYTVIKGYDYFVQLYFNNNIKSEKIIIKEDLLNVTATFEHNKKILLLDINNNDQIIFDLSDIIKLKDQQRETSIEKTIGNIKVKLDIKSFYGSHSKNVDKIDSIEAILLIKY